MTFSNSWSAPKMREVWMLSLDGPPGIQVGSRADVGASCSGSNANPGIYKKMKGSPPWCELLMVLTHTSLPIESFNGPLVALMSCKWHYCSCRLAVTSCVCLVPIYEPMSFGSDTVMLSSWLPLFIIKIILIGTISTYIYCYHQYH